MRRIVVACAALLGLTGRAEPVFVARFDGPHDLDGWHFRSDRGACAGTWDRAEPPPNGSSIRCDVPAEATARATWTAPKIDLQPSTAYRLRYRVMLGDVSDGSKGAYIILYQNGNPAPSHWHRTGFLKGTRDWHTRQLTFVTRPDTTWARLQCKLWECTGHVWYDDLVLEPIDVAETMAAETPAGRLVLPEDDGFPLQTIWYPAHRRSDRTLHLLGGCLNPLALFMWGDRTRVVDPHLILETPVGIEVRGPVVCGREPPPPPIDLVPERRERDGTPRLCWRLPVPEEALVNYLHPDGPRWERYHFVYAAPGADCPEAFTWFWQLEVDGSLGPRHTIPARVHPDPGSACEPVPGFDLYAQHSSALRLPTAAGRDRVLEYLHRAGIRGGLALSHYQPELLPIDNELATKGWHTWSWRWYGYGGPAAPGQELVYDTDQARRRGTTCPQVQVDMLEPHASWLREFYTPALALERNWLIMNYEPPTYQVCFCPRCRDAFARFAGLPEDRVMGLSPEEIQALPGHPWGRFRAWQNQHIIRNHARIIHSIDPDCLFGVCGPPATEWTANRGMDITLFEPDVGLHAPMIYSEPLDFEPLIRATCERTQARVMPFMLGSDIAVPATHPTAWDQWVNMLATCLSGADGAILWVGIESLDGETMAVLRRAMEQIRVLHPYIRGAAPGTDAVVGPWMPNTRTVSVPGRTLAVGSVNTRTPVRSWLWHGPHGHLLALINYDRQHAHAVMARATGILTARAIMGQQPETADGRLIVHLQPGQLCALVWQP